ncbi:MAG: divalent-cation tolerance protein CutA [Polynucleobacter sp.]|uniref:divalent-cation tolerance protein CutA n=1 Tax=Polynucleobacter sp. TaxID=2029855 RepID=UPI00216DF080|nr:divalent-cation tolerance protein CutA [Polynucleobacter sp.]MBU3670517.1 divalent-cation tolerance protein CutA [Polynucleobacter sp.]
MSPSLINTPLSTEDHLLVVVTALPDVDAAKGLARVLIDENLAACVQLGSNIQSIYRWEGKLCEEQEVLLSAKTLASKWQEILSVIQKNHPYELPEILAFSPEQYSQQYGDWVQAEVNKA